MSFCFCLCRKMSHYASPTGANRKSCERSIRDRIREAVQNPKAVINGVQLHTDWLCCVTVSRTVKDEGEPGKAPSRPEYKEAHRDSSSTASVSSVHIVLVVLLT